MSAKRHLSGEEEVRDKLQSALEFMHKLGAFVKIDTAGASFLPDDNPFEKIVAAYFKGKKHSPCFSTQKSIHAVGGRLLYSAAAEQSDVVPLFNSHGVVLWKHNWFNGKPRCYHGELMLTKQNEIELAGTSEMGMNALKEGRGVLCPNRFGRQVVKVVQENYMMCSEDSNCRFGQNSLNSCGMSFTDGLKASVAMDHAQSYGSLMFPKAPEGYMKKWLLIPSSCFCNYGGKTVVGKQIPKITPYALSGVEGLDADSLPIEMGPSVRHPAVFVYQCCNLGRKGDGPKPCEFKISFPDLLSVLVSVKGLWKECFGNSPKINIPVFKWSAQYRVRNVMLPSTQNASDEIDPFGVNDEKEQSKQTGGKKKRKRQRIESSEEEEDSDN